MADDELFRSFVDFPIYMDDRCWGLNGHCHLPFDHTGSCEMLITTVPAGTVITEKLLETLKRDAMETLLDLPLTPARD